MLKSTLLWGLPFIFLCSSFLLTDQRSESGDIDVKFENIECNGSSKTSLKLKKLNNNLSDELKVQFIVNSANQVQETKIRTITFSDQGVAKGGCEHPELLIDPSLMFSNESEPEVLDIKVRIL